jgi:hypothetical protein
MYLHWPVCCFVGVVLGGNRLGNGIKNSRTTEKPKRNHKKRNVPSTQTRAPGTSPVLGRASSNPLRASAASPPRTASRFPRGRYRGPTRLRSRTSGATARSCPEWSLSEIVKIIVSLVFRDVWTYSQGRGNAPLWYEYIAMY